MKKGTLILSIVSLFFILSCTSKRTGEPRILVFAKTAAFRHSSIPQGLAAIQQLGKQNGFIVDTTSNSDLFNEDSLSNYSAVVFLHTTGDVLNFRQQVAFERYIQAGGGFVGIHGAADAEYDWGWYGRLVGAYFKNHPKPQEANFIIKDKNHPATSFFTDTTWKRTEELYNFKKLNPNVNVLITVDESSYEGGEHNNDHPMAWHHAYDGGRAFYTALGHAEAAFEEDLFLKHLLGGIQYAIGENKILNYKKATSQFPPDEDRFVKTTLVQGEFFEPTEMTILPNLDVLIVQRRGEILLYKDATKKISQIGYLPVYWKAGVPNVNAEEGLMGICKDPNFAKNNWVYMFYSPVDSAVNRLSRFTIINDKFDRKTEKVILEVKSQRDICCHTGGSITFGPDGLLYLSTGDNSTPFNEPGAKFVNSGFGPLNDLPGRQQYDARRSSSNTNDLRGKILRIKVNEDGSYEIPDGNLFAKDQPATRPEIYVMGNRNPYRISVDQKNSYLYWGDVGPDASADSASRGSRGYDEVNQARVAGYFGWPLFIGNNYPYRAYDYATGESGDLFDPKKPINTSRNNTGLTELPPAQPAFIWYPYGPSSDFPQVATGGRNAMAGPVYYADLYPKETRLPDYYNGKLFIYEWIRGWIKAVTMLPNGDFDVMEPFMGSTRFNNCIDMEMGPDGRLYLLEYGAGWFSKNADATLTRIDFIAGNRPPVIKNFTVNKTTGALPFQVSLSATATDPENDKLTYLWDMGDGTIQETTIPEAEYTYKKTGEYAITLIVKDKKKAATQSSPFSVYAGNETPAVAINITGGNQSFYLPGLPIHYNIAITDKDDPSPIETNNLFVSTEYIEGLDKAGADMGHQQASEGISGKSIMLSLDCKSCHKDAEVSIGPSYTAIADKYKDKSDATSYLINKIIKGSRGVWGDATMAAHPSLSNTDAHQIVQWILSLSDDKQAKQSLPISGAIIPQPQKPTVALVLNATYTDKGGPSIKPLTGRNSIIFKSNYLQFSGKEKSKGFMPFTANNSTYQIIPNTAGWLQLDAIDLTGVKYIYLHLGWQVKPAGTINFEIKQGNPEANTIGQVSFTPSSFKDQQAVIRIPINATGGNALQPLYIVSTPGKNSATTDKVGIGMIQFSAN